MIESTFFSENSTEVEAHINTSIHSNSTLYSSAVPLIRSGIDVFTISHIFSFLPFASLGQYSSVCNFFYNATKYTKYHPYNENAKVIAQQIVCRTLYEITKRYLSKTETYSLDQKNTYREKIELPLVKLCANKNPRTDHFLEKESSSSVIANMFLLAVDLSSKRLDYFGSSRSAIITNDNTVLNSVIKHIGIKQADCTSSKKNISNSFLKQYSSLFETEKAKSFINLCLLYVKQILSSKISSENFCTLCNTSTYITPVEHPYQINFLEERDDANLFRLNLIQKTANISKLVARNNTIRNMYSYFLQNRTVEKHSDMQEKAYAKEIAESALIQSDFIEKTLKDPEITLEKLKILDKKLDETHNVCTEISKLLFPDFSFPSQEPVLASTPNIYD